MDMTLPAPAMDELPSQARVLSPSPPISLEIGGEGLG